MWTFQLGHGWGGLPPTNVHSFEIAEIIGEYGEYFQIEFDARHWTDKLSLRLEDSSGCRHNLPHFFRAGELKTFNIIVDGSAGISEYFFTCSLHIWPKEFPTPIAKFKSLSTVQIMPPELRKFSDTRKYTQSTPRLRTRRKGEEEWKDSIFLLTFTDEIIEAQFYTTLENGSIINSPILEVSSMWREFEFEKECQIDLEELNLHRRINLIFDKEKFYKTEVLFLLKKLEPADSDDNKEVIIGGSGIDCDVIKIEKKQLIPGARYELKLEVKTLNISYNRIFQVPSDHPIDNALWTALFGSADRVTFTRKEAQKHRAITSFIAPIGSLTEVNIEISHITLYKHGFYSYKKTFQAYKEAYPAREKSDFSGVFALFGTDTTNVRINLTKLFKEKVSTKPTIELSPLDLAYQETNSAALLFPELLRTIVSYDSENRKRSCRLVCKSWCLALDPTAISGTVTAEAIELFNVVHSIAINSKAIKS